MSDTKVHVVLAVFVFIDLVFDLLCILCTARVGSSHSVVDAVYETFVEIHTLDVSSYRSKLSSSSVAPCAIEAPLILLLLCGLRLTKKKGGIVPLG